MCIFKKTLNLPVFLKIIFKLYVSISQGFEGTLDKEEAMESGHKKALKRLVPLTLFYLSCHGRRAI